MELWVQELRLRLVVRVWTLGIEGSLGLRPLRPEPGQRVTLGLEDRA